MVKRIRLGFGRSGKKFIGGTSGNRYYGGSGWGQSSGGGGGDWSGTGGMGGGSKLAKTEKATKKPPKSPK